MNNRPLLGTEGNIDNESPEDLQLLVTENLDLKAKLVQATLLIREQAVLIAQIKQEIESGNLIPKERIKATRPG